MRAPYTPGVAQAAAEAKGHKIKYKLAAVSQLDGISKEVRGWQQPTAAHGDIVMPTAGGQDRSQARLNPCWPTKLLLVISLICRLELLQQEFQESCSVSSVQVPPHSSLQPESVVLALALSFFLALETFSLSLSLCPFVAPSPYMLSLMS